MMTKKQKNFIGVAWVAFIVGMLVAVSPIQASYGYNFPPRENNPVITMDVYKNGPGGGTYKCTSVVACYSYVRAAEDRGAVQYCNKIVIKRNGYPVITRDYEKRREFRWTTE